MADIDLMAPEISKVVKGMDGKVILIYGCNKCGKTYNAAQAKKPLVLAFERGLGALGGVPYFYIRTWSDFRKIVKELADPRKFESLHEKYNTIVVDAIDGIERLSEMYVCAQKGISSIREFNGGYGAWKEWANEIDSQIRLLVGSGFTIVFLAHEGTRKFISDDGAEYEMVYPRGDKRIVDPILNYVDITAYVRLAGLKDNGEQALSSLYLKGNLAFFAGGRFPEIRTSIPEWTWDKFEAALKDAISRREQAAGGEVVSNSDVLKTERAIEAKRLDSQKSIAELQTWIKETVKQNVTKEQYPEILKEAIGDPSFKVNAATEAQRELLEAIVSTLREKGYEYVPAADAE